MLILNVYYASFQAILVYRGFRTLRKRTLKWTHSILHMIIFILTVLALQAVFNSHNLSDPPKPNMYSLHSWLGIGAVVLFSLQMVSGFYTFLIPGVKEHIRMALMPYHIFFGLFGFVLSIASALMGLTEIAIFAL